MIRMRDIAVPRITAVGFILIAAAQMGFLLGSALMVISGSLINVVIGAAMGTLATAILTMLTRLFVLDQRILSMRRFRPGS